MPARQAVHLRGVQVTRPLLASWPASVLSPNNRKHWRLKSDAKRLQRCEWAYVALGMGMKAKLTDGQKLDVRLEFYPPDRKIRDADNLLANYGHRILKAWWGNTVKSDFLAEIVVTGIDDGPGVINRLTNRIADMGINIRQFSISGEGGYFEGRISLIVANTDQLQRAIIALREFHWVTGVSRVE